MKEVVNISDGTFFGGELLWVSNTSRIIGLLILIARVLLKAIRSEGKTIEEAIINHDLRLRALME